MLKRIVLLGVLLLAGIVMAAAPVLAQSPGGRREAPPGPSYTGPVMITFILFSAVLWAVCKPAGRHLVRD